MKLLAHRGASHDAPENTCEAFSEAVRQGADGVELDAMVCGSGEVVVCHDEELARLAGLPWHVRHTPLWKLRQADVGSRLGFAAAKIPTLDEVLDLLPRHLLVNVELKCERFDDDGLSVKVAQRLSGMPDRERFVLSSFNPLCLFRAAAVDPALQRGMLIDPDQSFFLQRALVSPLVSSYSVHPHHGAVTRARAAAWQELGLNVAAWTVDAPEEARRLRDLQVAYCITNRPAFLRAAL